MRNKRQKKGEIMMPQHLAKYIDHTLLKPESTEKDILRLCLEAKKYRFKAVCVNPYYVPTAAKALEGTDVQVATVVGFPLGSTSTFAKVCETKEAILNGATEIDMVLNIGALKSKKELDLYHDIKSVVKAASGKALVKVILETGLLTDEEKQLACRIAKEAGADFVKTSTGFGSGGATVEDVRLLRETVGETMGVKASGGIRDAKTALAMIEAGANRIGTSAGVNIVTSE